MKKVLNGPLNMTVNKKRQTCLSEEYYASEDSQNYNYQLKKSVVYLFVIARGFKVASKLCFCRQDVRAGMPPTPLEWRQFHPTMICPTKWENGREAEGGERSVEKSGFGERKLARGIVSSIPIVHPRTPNQPEGEEIKRAREKGGQTSFRSGILLSPSYTFDCDWRLISCTDDI